MTKLTILHAGLASYTVAFFNELAKTHAWRIQLIHQPIAATAPYDKFDLGALEEVFEDAPSVRRHLFARVDEFKPDCVLMSSWNFGQYRKIARRLKAKRTLVISTMDHQWLGTPKQWLGVAASRFFLKPCISTFIVTGDRQAQFARKLGFDDVLYGYYAADIAPFAAKACGSEHRRREFLYVGRLVEAKGIRILIDAYWKYRRATNDPWALRIVGSGPLKHVVEHCEGVVVEDFVQPSELPQIMGRAGCFLLPSVFEPWGVVIHEAAAAGLPIICSDRCGALTYFVRDGVNGYIVPPRADALADAMEKLSSIDMVTLSEMGAFGANLAALWTPQRLAKYFASEVASRLSGNVQSKESQGIR